MTDAELLTLAAAQALPGVPSEAWWLRAAVPLLKRVIRMLVVGTDLWTDATWIVDSTPVECARSRETAKRSELAGWAGYGYCSSHSRFFWGLRLHLVCTPAGLPITWALANPKIDERQVIMTARIAQRLLALTAAIWHNRATNQPVTRSLIAFDHQPVGTYSSSCPQWT